MRTTRRSRKLDPLANLLSVRSVCGELQKRCPDIVPKTDKQLFSFLTAMKYIHLHPKSEKPPRRPPNWQREALIEASTHLKAILEEKFNKKVSISGFAGVYLRILLFPSDVLKVLEEGKITLQEALALARLTPNNLSVSHQKAFAIRKEVIDSHIKVKASQNTLRSRVKEILGETNVISADVLIANIEMVDKMLELDPNDKRHLFYEELKNLFFAIRSFPLELVDDEFLADFNAAFDELVRVINSAQRRYRQKQKTSPSLPFHV